MSIKDIFGAMSKFRLKEVLIMLLSLTLGLYGYGLAGAKDTADIAEAIAKISSKRIYFGHQSVGQNIIEGIKDIARDHPKSGLKVVESSEPNTLSVPAFVHSRLGRNTEPDTKIMDFKKIISNGMGRVADIAFFKFCYIDITADTNVDELFRQYKKTMTELKKQYPNTVFVHVTAPLTVAESGEKTFLKKLFGRQTSSDNNKKRNQFNTLMKAEYAGKEPVFDLAAIEAQSYDGNGAILSLARDYTEDGEHLNKKGRRIVAEALIKFLANIKTAP